MKYVILGTLIVVSLIHIIGLFFSNYKIKAITKPLIVPLILGFYLLSTQNVNWLIFAALACGWLGDIALLFKTKKGMVAGAFLFLFEQIILVVAIALIVNFSKISLFYVITLPIIYITCAIVFHFIFIRKYQKGTIFTLSNLYLASNGIANAFALVYALSNPTLKAAILFAGTTLFFISDAILIYSRLTKKMNLDPKHIFIMITYILAQTAIVISFIL